MAENKGKIDVAAGERFLADHYDTYDKKTEPDERTLCGHVDLSPRGMQPWQPPYGIAGAVQNKVTDAAMAEHLTLAALAGHACGIHFKAAEHLKTASRVRLAEGIPARHERAPMGDIQRGDVKARARVASPQLAGLPSIFQRHWLAPAVAPKASAGDMSGASSSAMRAARLESVPYTEHGFDVGAAIVAEALAQAADVDVQGARPNIRAVAPDEHQQSVTRDELAGMTHQKCQQGEGFESEFHPRAIEQYGFAVEI